MGNTQFQIMNNLKNTMKNPLVSWLICSHIYDDRLRESITSCLKQTYENFEIVLVANGQNCELINKEINILFPRNNKIRIFQTKISGITFSLNLGLHYAKGTLIARMDADDISNPERLEKQVKYMIENPKVSLLGSFYKIIDENGIVVKQKVLPTGNYSIRKSLLYTNPICHPSVLYKKSIAINVGGYMGGIYGEDYDLWVRLSNNPNIIFENIPEYLLFYRNVGAGPARRSRQSYAAVCARQIQQFVIGKGIIWLFSSIITYLKSTIRSVD